MVEMAFWLVRLLIAFGILAVFGSGAFAQQLEPQEPQEPAEARTWNEFTPDNRGWSILSPGVMKPDAEALKTPSNKGSYSYNDASGFFSVIYRDGPKRRYLPWKFNREGYYDKIRNNAVKGVKGKLLSETEFTNGNISGREIQVKLTKVLATGRESRTKTVYRVERARLFFSGRRFYVVLLVLPEEEINSPAANAFLNSFVLNLN